VRLFPQIGCILHHWGAAAVAGGEIDALRSIAAHTQRTYAARFGEEFYRATVWARVHGQQPIEPVFLAIGPAVVSGPEVKPWLQYWEENGSVELRLAAMYGAIFLSDEEEGMGFLVQRIFLGKLVGGLLTTAHEVLDILGKLRDGRCSRCNLCGVPREVLPSTLVTPVRET
jgi:hypothetical protein